MHLISFVGTTDINLASEKKGPVWTAVSRLEPDSVTLIITESASKLKEGELDYMERSASVKRLLESIEYKSSEQSDKKLSPRVFWRPMTLVDPTDHNEIYPKLKNIVQDLATEYKQLAAAISSGTPAMQVCWILLAESGEVHLPLYRTIDPEKSTVVIKPVKLDTHLPRIIGLEKENRRLVKRTKSLEDVAFQTVRLNIEDGRVQIGDADLNLSRRQFTYYRFFLESVLKDPDSAGLRLEGENNIPKVFIESIVRFDEETWKLDPDRDIQILSEILKNEGDPELDLTVFRSNLSKLNKKISDALDTQAGLYQVQYVGRAKLRSYTVLIPPDKISIIEKVTTKS